MRTSSQSSPTDFARFSETLVLMKKRAESLGLYPRSQSLLLKNNLGSGARMSFFLIGVLGV